MWCNDGKIITKGEHAYRVFLQLEKMTPLHKMTLIDDTDCQNILATTVLSLQAITAQKDVKDPWKLLPPAGQLIERIGAMRDSKVFIKGFSPVGWKGRRRFVGADGKAIRRFVRAEDATTEAGPDVDIGKPHRLLGPVSMGTEQKAESSVRWWPRR